MPDELTHVIIGFFLAEGMRLGKTWKKTLVVFGSVIPDLFKFVLIISLSIDY